MAAPNDPNDANQSRYWAFISYSSKDAAWAKWLHASIETYGIPTSLAGKSTPAGTPAPKRFHPVFKDRDELPAGADLGTLVVRALEESKYLIVICSPNSAASKWVNNEVDTFIGMGRQDRILALIVDGAPPACFPAALREVEPIAADAREVGDGKANAKLKLIAGMLGVSFDALKQRDTARRLRRLRVALALVAVLVGVFAALAWYANGQRILARSSEQHAVDALAHSDFREGIVRLRDPATTAEGVALLARSARLWGGGDRARTRLWTLMQQRAFWVETPDLLGKPLPEPVPVNTDPGKFEMVEYGGKQLKPDGVVRSGDGRTVVTFINGDMDETYFRHFRAWRPDGTPITGWLEMNQHNLDARRIGAVHLSRDGKFAAVVGEVWREPELLELWDLEAGKEIGEVMRATGTRSDYQAGRFTRVEFSPTPGDADTTLLLAASSRGDVSVHRVGKETVEPLGENHHAAAVVTASIDPQARWLMSASADQQAIVCDLWSDRQIGNTTPLPDAPIRIGRVAGDRVRVEMASVAPLEFRLVPPIVVTPPGDVQLSPSAMEDEHDRAFGSAATTEPAATQPTAAAEPLDRSPDGRTLIRPDGRSQIQLRRVGANGTETTAWTHRTVTAIWRARLSGSSVIVQTDGFTTEILDLTTGRRVGTTIDETRTFEFDVRPTLPLVSSLSPSQSMLLTRSFFWNPPNAGHHWFTAWDVRTGVALTDPEHVSEDAGTREADRINAADFSGGERYLLLGTAARIPRCIELTPPPEVSPNLPELAEALAGLKAEADGSFSRVPERIATIERITAGRKRSEGK